MVLVNTCGFLDSAKEESLAAIGEAIAENGRVIVTGCMGNEADVDPCRAFPTFWRSPARINTKRWSRRCMPRPACTQGPFIDLIPQGGLKLTPRHYSYLKISEGCNHRCAFCIIPSLRGKLASRRIDAVLREAEKLVAAGTQELLVISQDTSAYGVDTRHEAARLEGPRGPRAHDRSGARAGRPATPQGIAPWVRLHYVYPYPHVDEVIPLMAEGLLTPYLDIPFQHAAPNVLKAMKRPANEAKVLERIQNWRAICPDIAIRFSFVVGFPGETEADFQYLLDWLDEAQLDRVGAFRFEPVEGAAANALAQSGARRGQGRTLRPDHGETERSARPKLAAKVGRTLPVIIDEVGEPDEDGDIGATGPQPGRRTGNRRRSLPARCRGCRAGTGDIVDVAIEDADEHDLFGVIAG